MPVLRNTLCRERALAVEHQHDGELADHATADAPPGAASTSVIS